MQCFQSPSPSQVAIQQQLQQALQQVAGQWGTADEQLLAMRAELELRQEEFEKTIDALNQRAAIEPNNPEAFYTISTYYWDKAYRDFRLKDAEKQAFVTKGIEQVDKALQLKADYMEALTYKNLLLRLQANLEKDPAKQASLLKEADRLRDQALEMKKKQVAGIK